MERKLTIETLESLHTRMQSLRPQWKVLVHIAGALDTFRMLRKSGYQVKRVPERSWWQVFDGDRAIADVYVHTWSMPNHDLLFVWEYKLPELLFPSPNESIWKARFRL